MHARPAPSSAFSRICLVKATIVIDLLIWIGWRWVTHLHGLLLVPRLVLPFGPVSANRAASAIARCGQHWGGAPECWYIADTQNDAALHAHLWLQRIFGCGYRVYLYCLIQYVMRWFVCGYDVDMYGIYRYTDSDGKYLPDTSNVDFWQVQKIAAGEGASCHASHVISLSFQWHGYRGWIVSSVRNDWSEIHQILNGWSLKLSPQQHNITLRLPMNANDKTTRLMHLSKAQLGQGIQGILLGQEFPARHIELSLCLSFEVNHCRVGLQECYWEFHEFLYVFVCFYEFKLHEHFDARPEQYILLE